MPTALRSFFMAAAMTFAFLLLVEAALEFRHYRKGYSTLLFGQKEPARAPDAGDAASGPTPEFPFRSAVVQVAKPANSVRLWVASASYAAAVDLPPSASFANQLCRTFSAANGRPCQTLNNSAAAWTTSENIEQLKRFGAQWQPDFVMLYEMSNDIEYYSGKHLDAPSTLWNFDNGIFDTVRAILQGTVEQTSLYSHVRHYIGGSVLLSAQLPASLPEKAIGDFRTRLETFIRECRNIGATPVLLTFAASNDVRSMQSMPLDYKFQVLRYNGNLSPEGWVHSIDRLNEIIRQVGRENDVMVADVAAHLDRRPEYYKDFFHFTAQGHDAMASLIGSLLSRQVNATLAGS
jgi:lysophospholipase L1-like esterase